MCSKASLRKNYLVRSVYIISEKIVLLVGVELIKFARLRSDTVHECTADRLRIPKGYMNYFTPMIVSRFSYDIRANRFYNRQIESMNFEWVEKILFYFIFTNIVNDQDERWFEIFLNLIKLVWIIFFTLKFVKNWLIFFFEKFKISNTGHNL